ncbi:unnamed protein product [Sympodiomycopsis kandeliae]
MALPTSPPSFDDEIYDLLGVGFGPANVALAISLTESQEVKSKGLKYGFIERQPTFMWHPSLLLPGAQLQVSPLKDLATMRDPTSTFTFVNYLHTMGRLSASINREANIPSRREWSAYLTWCASRLDHLVNYGEDVLSVEPVANSGHSKACIEHALNEANSATPAGQVRLLRVTSRLHGSGKIVVRLARNLTIGVGGSPKIPAQLSHLYPSNPREQRSRLIHSGTFLPSLNAIEPELSGTVERRLGRSSPASRSNWPLRFAVIGAGQSSAEIALHLRRTFPSAAVHLIFRASALVPSDDSAFVNSIAFDPERTDAFWKCGEQERADWRREFKRTNYSVVRSDVLNELSEHVYNQSIEIQQLYPGSDGPAEGHLEIMPNTVVETAELVNVSEGNNQEEQVRLVLKSLKTPDPAVTYNFDAVVMGTGFERRPAALPFLEPLKQHFPLLDQEKNGIARRVELGFTDDDDSRTMSGSDELAKERVRERSRGITRDYRLVAWGSDSFQQDSAGQESQPSSATLSRRNSANSEITLAHQDDVHKPFFQPNVYTFGGNEATHGLSDSLLSICAWRAGEVTESLLKRLPGRSDRQVSAKADELVTVDESAPLAQMDVAAAKKNAASSVSNVQNKIADIVI